MLLLTIDRRSSIPVYRQIIDAVVALVDGGTLSPGDRLPPSRTLAQTTGIHRSTVVRAYEELWALGYLESRPGSYSIVRRPGRPAPATQPSGGGLIDWDAVSAPPARDAVRAIARLPVDASPAPGLIDFATLAADPSLAPVND